MRQCSQAEDLRCGCGKCICGQEPAEIRTHPREDIPSGATTYSTSVPEDRVVSLQTLDLGNQDPLVISRTSESEPEAECKGTTKDISDSSNHQDLQDLKLNPLLWHVQKAFSEMGSCSSRTKSHSVFHLDTSRSKELLQLATSGGNRNKNKNVVCADLRNVKTTTGEPNSGNTKGDGGGNLSAASFSVLKIKASIDKKPTTLDEKSAAVLKYKTPHFRAVATVEIPALPEKHGLQIGWIQTCTQMKFINTYGSEGITSWEFPEIESGKYSMVSDSDGKMYPWYGAKHEVTTVNGPSLRQMVTVHMNDNFFPQVTWYIPHSMFDRTARLTHVYRKQKFHSFLVVKDLVSGQHYVLRTIVWSMELNIKVNPLAPLGKRAQIDIISAEQEQPRILDNNPVALETQALSPPNANNSQALVWRPSVGEPRVVVPPVHSTVDLEKYLLATRDLGETLVKCGKDNSAS